MDLNAYTVDATDKNIMSRLISSDLELSFNLCKFEVSRDVNIYIVIFWIIMQYRYVGIRIPRFTRFVH